MQRVFVVKNAESNETEGVFATLNAAKKYCEFDSGCMLTYIRIGTDDTTYWWRSVDAGSKEALYFVEPHPVWDENEVTE